MSSEPRLTCTSIELHVPDLQRAYDFYKKLGLALVRMEESYMILADSLNVLCFYGEVPDASTHEFFGNFPPNTLRGYGIEIILFNENIGPCYETFRNSEHLAAPLQLRPWGAQDFRVADPFGYYLRMSEPYDISAPPGIADQTSTVLRKKNFSL